MKITMTFLVTFIAIQTFGQPYTNDDFVQNFYISCKAEKFSAFMALQKGTELLETSQYGRSIKSYNKAFEIDSSCCDALYMLAYCYQRQGDYNQAIVHCDKSIKMNAHNISAWTIKGSTLLLLKDTANALICFENAKKYGSTQIDGYYGMALVYYYQQKYKEALSVINEFESNEKNVAIERDKKKMRKLKEKVAVK